MCLVLFSCDIPKHTLLFVLFAERITQTVEITKHTVDIEEKGVKLKLTIVDTPGFGDAVNNTEWYVLYQQNALENSEQDPPLARGCTSSPRRLNVLAFFCFSWKSVADYIDQQFEQYFRDESGLNRKNIQDNRVHCCLYFISPFGHG